VITWCKNHGNSIYYRRLRLRPSQDRPPNDRSPADARGSWLTPRVCEQDTRGLERAREGGALGATMSYTQLHAATSMLHWIFTSTSRDTVFFMYTMGPPEPRYRNPSTQCRTQREPRPYKTPHDHSTNPVSTLGIVTSQPPQHQGSPTLALDWNGTKINPDSAGPRESRPHLLLWS
jgi:hypothetical protein